MCETGNTEEAELHWRDDREAALARCTEIKHVFARTARDCPEVTFLALEVDSTVPRSPSPSASTAVPWYPFPGVNDTVADVVTCRRAAWSVVAHNVCREVGQALDLLRLSQHSLGTYVVPGLSFRRGAGRYGGGAGAVRRAGHQRHPNGTVLEGGRQALGAPRHCSAAAGSRRGCAPVKRTSSRLGVFSAAMPVLTPVSCSHS